MSEVAGLWSCSRIEKNIVAGEPDRAGIWADESAGLLLSHRRLSIRDFPHIVNQQPLISPCSQYVLAYGGEIYNHENLRAELETEGGHFDWQGQSDAETLLAALRHWGINKTLRRLNGTFVFALWSVAERTLYLARDRMGEKPLYYGRSGDTFLFGSELKTLTAFPSWRGEVDRDVLALYLRYSYVPTPWSIYRGIQKLPPAHFLVVRENGMQVGDPQCYWSLAEVAERGIAEAAIAKDPTVLVDELEALLRETVRQRMIASVPLGAFLSGGYDSTTVVALMQAQSEQAVKTFSIGFYEEEYNEAQYAGAVAAHLGTNHTELYVTPEEAIAVIPRLSDVYDEPFSDSSQIPTLIASQLARQHVRVALSGDGGDELFCGYNRHVLGPNIWRRIERLPLKLRLALGETLALVVRGGGSRILNKLIYIPLLDDKLSKVSEALKARDGLAFYKSLVSRWKQPESLVPGGQEPVTILDQPEGIPRLTGLREQMMYLDMMTYLPDDILAKVGRASIAVGLETRVPLLDHRVVEFAWRVPTEYKYREGQGKWLLRQVLYRYVPSEIMERPKMGFGVPIEHWLRGPLRDWAEALLDEHKLREQGFFDPAPIRRIWSEHVSGRRGQHYNLWDVLMFQAWLESQEKNAETSKTAKDVLQGAGN